MKKPLFIAAAVILILTSCEHDKPVEETDPDQEIIVEDFTDHDIILTIGPNLIYDYSDIELYDSSTYILYFKTSHPEFDKIKQSPFQFFVNGDTIYKGDFWPSYFSSIPSGPYISNYPLFYPNYALRIDNRNINKPDLRNDPRLIQALKDRNLLHSGLFIRINSIIFNTSQITFSFDITNMDQSELLILDPDKMGLGLFHYFTNGLVMRNLPDGLYFYVKIPYQTPSPWNGWKIDWLSKISPGETKAYVFNYPISSPLSQGEYSLLFEFPGLSYQVTRDQLYQNNIRIWLGDVEVTKIFSIN